MLGAEKFLKYLMAHNPHISSMKIWEIKELLSSSKVVEIKAVLNTELPSLLNECVDFYFSRSGVRASLDLELFPFEPRALEKWSGPYLGQRPGWKVQ